MKEMYNKEKKITILIISASLIFLLSSLITIYYNPNNLQEQINIQLINFAISIVVILFLIKKLEKIFTLPIFILRDVIEDVSKHKNYKLHVTNNNNDEFASLFNGFNNMIDTINEQNLELEKQKKFVQTLLDSQEQLVITTDGELITSVNKTFLKFFGVKDIESFKKQYNTNTISTTFNTGAPSDYLQRHLKDGTLWIDYVVNNTNYNKVTKVMISRNNKDYVFSVNGDELPSDNGLKSAIFTDITEMEQTKRNLEKVHKHTRDSIEYASLIQGSLIPDDAMFEYFFKDYFVHWSPKDTVGGDIYLFETLRHEDEALLLYIDCTGHGVPGAFVTMIVKAIEREVVSKIKKDDTMDVSTAWIMKYFNRTMKVLLMQEQDSSISNTGFDGGIVYYNKKDKILKFSGAQIPLFYVDTSGEYHMVKGNRYSVGYTQCSIDYDYKESIIKVESGMKFYCTTDGYIDQNGGAKDFPFGKKSFGNIIKQNHSKTMLEQKNIFIEKMKIYESMVEDNERNDDMTVIGFEI